MEVKKNPLLKDGINIEVNVEELKHSAVYVKDQKINPTRLMKDLRRGESAREAIEGFKKGVEIYGFTKGQFSLSDLIVAILEKTGKADLYISTWTAAKANVAKMIDLINDGMIREAFWLVDFTFHRRSPELSMEIRKVFGENCVRIAKNHAKFALIKNDNWEIVLRTSMNLNQNPRFENFTVAHDPELSGFLSDLLSEIWGQQDKNLAFKTFKDMNGKV